MKRINQMVSQMNSDLNGLGYTDLTANINAEKALNHVTDTFYRIRTYVTKNGFRSFEDEIQFFKTVRPKVASRIGFIAFVIEYMHISTISVQMREDLIDQKSTYFKLIIAENKNHIVRMNRNMQEDDDKFFMRNKFIAPTNTIGNEVLLDPNFTTFHSLLKEKLLTYELIQKFLNNMSASTEKYLSPLVWTGSKAALTELMYSLYHAQSLNNGNLDISLLTRTFEQIFNVDLGDVYRTFHEIKNRNEPTKFIDKLKSVILNKVEEDNEFRPK